VGDASKRLQATSATISGMARHDALLFDFDGTIADSRVPYTRSLNHALAEVGLPTHAPEDLYQYLGPPMQQTLTEFLQVPAELVDRVTALYRELYAQIGPTETRAYDGIPELLRTLHGRLPLAVATSKILPLAEMLLEQMGLRELFDVVAAPAPDVVNESKSTTIASALASTTWSEPARMDCRPSASCGALVLSRSCVRPERGGSPRLLTRSRGCSGSRVAWALAAPARLPPAGTFERARSYRTAGAAPRRSGDRDARG
jgi:phosphoglycolate phosphatase